MKTRIVLSLALLATLGFGQLLSVSVSPNPAPVGTPITINVNDTYNLGLYTPFGNLVYGIYSPNPQSPNLALFGGTFLGVPIDPCGPTFRTYTWDQMLMTGPATPGDYWIEVSYSFGPFGAISSEFFPVTIEAAPPAFYAKPTITALNAPVMGTTYMLDITGPNRSGDSYIMAMSGSSNVGIPLGPVHFAPDIDPIFNLTFPTPTPGLFTNFQGNLDVNGNATGIGFAIPNFPPILCATLHLQAYIVPPPGASWPIDLTACHTFTLQ